MGKKEFADDDGRTISDMTFTEKTSWYENFAELTNRKDKTPKSKNVREAKIELTKAETRSFIYSTVISALLIAGLFIGVFYLFILFCIHVWFQY